MEHRPPIVTGKAEVVWSLDGRTVTKSYDEWSTPVLGSTHDCFDNELAANRLLLAQEPPFRRPALVSANPERRTLTFDAVVGEPIGPKFPLTMSDADVGAILDVVRALAGYRPDALSLRSFPIVDRMGLHVRSGLIDARLSSAIDTVTSSRPWQFAHGDVTARNVLRGATGEMWLIDWEWAGSYPSHYDVAFFWFSLIDVVGGRERVEASVPAADRVHFLAAAALVQLLHLQMWTDRGASLSNERGDAHGRSLASTLVELGACVG